MRHIKQINCYQSVIPHTLQKMQSKVKNHQKSQNNSQRNEQSINLIAGLFAGFISVTICNPLDIARTRLNLMQSPQNNSNKYTHFSHAMRTIWKEEGFKGFYAGYRTNVIAIPLFHSIFFPIYQYAKKKAKQQGYSSSISGLFGTLTAGTISNILTNPIWVVRTRLMAQYLHPEHRQYQTSAPFKIMRQMVDKEGFTSLFKGLSASMLSISNAVLYFYFYQNLKEMISKNHSVSIFTIFLSSTISKIIASSATYPLIVVRTVLHDEREKQKLSFIEVCKHIKRQSGMWGFYGGLKPDLIRLIPSNAILFITYQMAKKLL